MQPAGRPDLPGTCPDGTIVAETCATFTASRQLVVTSSIRNVRMEEPPVTVRRVRRGEISNFRPICKAHGTNVIILFCE
jgi:hypothetical protein